MTGFQLLGGMGSGAGSFEGSPGRLQQVGARFGADQFGALGQAIEDRRHFGASLGARTVVVLAADDHASQFPLS